MSDFSSKQLQSVIITGSRIRQDPLSAPMPLVTIDRPQLEDSGAENLADAATQLRSISVGVGLANQPSVLRGSRFEPDQPP